MHPRRNFVKAGTDEGSSLGIYFPLVDVRLCIIRTWISVKHGYYDGAVLAVMIHIVNCDHRRHHHRHHRRNHRHNHHHFSSCIRVRRSLVSNRNALRKQTCASRKTKEKGRSRTIGEGRFSPMYYRAPSSDTRRILLFGLIEPEIQYTRIVAQGA